jgi:hypothetical protein
MRYALCALLTLGACVTGPQIAPPNDQQEVSASAAGATITAFLSPWEGQPSDLTDYMTPIALEFVNQSGAPVRVSYIDLVLTDDSGHRFIAYNPYVGDGSVAAVDGVQVAVRGGGHFGGGGHISSGRHFGGPIGHPSIHVRGGVAFGRWSHQHFNPWHRGGVWNPLWYPAGYSSWVWIWSPRIYGGGAPPLDVRELGLPEGVLDPGGRAAGYVYFEPAAQRSGNLALAWDVHTADGAPMGRAQIPLEVVR